MGKEEQELNKKLAEWADLQRVHILPKGNFFGLEEGCYAWDTKGNRIPCNFTQSLDACDKWLTPKVTAGQGGIEFRYYPGGVRCIITVEDETGFSNYESWIKASYEGEAQKFSALALCKAIEKLIDGDK